MRTAGAIAVAVSALGINTVDCADREAGNARDADHGAAARAVCTAGAITMAMSAVSTDGLDGADSEAGNDGDTDQ